MPSPFDLFISFHRNNADPVKRLVAALESQGMNCVARDDGTTGLPPELAESKAFLAWASDDYFRATNGQKLLATALIARRREPATAPERVLLINAGTSRKHIYPIHLRGHVFAPAPGLPDAPEVGELAEYLRDHSLSLAGTLGELCRFDPPRWREACDGVAGPAPCFEGRERELWDIYDALHPAPELTAAPPGPAVVVSASAGQGKSALAREYAFRFGPAYPGGVFRLTAQGGRPAASLAELADNPPLKTQLAALLRQLAPETDPTGLDVPALSARLGGVLADARQAFLWIVDDLPEGLNGPAFRQWLAPPDAAPWGRTLILTRSRRYGQRATPLNLPPLDVESARRLLIRNAPPASDSEREAVDVLHLGLGRHAMSVALAGALAGLDKRRGHGPYGDLWRQLDRVGPKAADLAVRLPGLLPEGREADLAALLLCAVHGLDLAGRDLLRLAGELAGDACLPVEFITDCYARSGLSAEEKKVRSFAIFLQEPHAEPMHEATARAHAEAGMARLESLALGERLANGIRVYPAAARLMALADAEPVRRWTLHRAALHALYNVAEPCVVGGDWCPLAPLAAHARVLVAGLQDRPIDPAEDSIETTRRVRLACILADLDTAQGDWKPALKAYQDASAFLLRAMAAEPDNAARQRDFAVAQERIGDLLITRGDIPGALNGLRRSLGIRALFAKQDPDKPERQHDLLRHHTKIGDLLKQQGDLGGALYSYRAAHAVLEKLAAHAPSNAERRFDLAASHERLATLYIKTNEIREAWAAMHAALKIYEFLAGKNPNQIKLVRAPGAIYTMMGDLLRARPDLAGALGRYRAALAVAEKVAAMDPSNPEFQRNLALNHNNIGNVLAALEDPAGAAEHYRAYLAAAAPLLVRDTDPAHHRDLAVGHIKLGLAIEALPDGDKADALAQYREARDILEKLTDGTEEGEGKHRDLAWVTKRIDKLSEQIEPSEPDAEPTGS
ncbi:hypothetical protein [Methylomagnum sp.]